ncbi:hypothetical protein [Ammoniphilus sp. CFH 90114]|uniref:hypothetical protein n=1 Tax=Ammoniphilus sp. CFH 90114 TaxID=2493665 RepID=UPI00100F0F81|nr:hypothetical protein [Ammoniphilus sp. CFH 90114]RXT02816.1 hypothetical protein EIZ39_24360 [Ammoniphilus sp. CFH 90114]
MEWFLSQKWLIFIEVMIVSFGIYRMVNIIKTYKRQDEALTVHEKIENTINQMVKNSFLRSILLREVLMCYYLFSKKANHLSEGRSFTFHKDSSYVPFQIAILSSLILEGVGLSFLLHKWQPWVAWLHLILTVYAIIFILGDLKAISRNRLVIKDEEIAIQFGFRYKVSIPLSNIKNIQSGKVNFEQDKKKKDRFTIALLEFEEPHFELILEKSQVIKDSLGRKRKVRNIFLSIDQKDIFNREIQEQCQKLNA